MKYADMFSICRNPSKYQHSDGVIYEHRVEYDNIYDLPDPNKYDVTRSKIIENANDNEYYLSFLIRLGKVHNVDVPEFLDYHFNFTPNKERFFAVVRTRLTEDFKGDNPTKAAIIREWLDENKAMLKNIDPSVLNAKTDPSVLTPLARHWALFFAYLNPVVLDVKPTIERFCKERRANVTGGNVRQQYYKREYHNAKKRAISENSKDIEFVINHFLKDCPERAIAENEIKTAKWL
jgi:hypothetical protein